MVNDQLVDQVRRFERLYEHYLRSAQGALASEDFAVADIHVVHEIGFAEGGASGAWLAGRLELDAGYLCRILKKLEAHGFVAARASANDRRMKEWYLTRPGRDFAAGIEDEYRARARFRLIGLRPGEQHELTLAIGVVERLLRETIRTR